MDASNKKIGTRQALLMHYRALKILNEKNPNLFLSSFLYHSVKSFSPYVTIYLSAQIINELAGNRNSIELKQLVVFTLVSVALLGLINGILFRWYRYASAQSWYQYQRILSEKMMKMDFSSIDDPHTHDLNSQITQNANWADWGLHRTIDYFERLITAAAGILGAVTLTVSLFATKVPDTASELVFLNHPLCIACVLGLLLLTIYVVPACSNKANSYWARNAAIATEGNRFFGFFGFMAYYEGHERALDIRMYNQQDICLNYSRKNTSFTSKGQMAKYAAGAMGLLEGLASMISVLFIGFIYIFVCLKAWGGAFGVGSATQYIGAITALMKSASQFLEVMGSMKNNAPFLKLVYEFLEIPNAMYQGSLTTEKRSDRQYEVEFRDVSFKYPNTDVYALRHVSMKFKVGKRIAVVGMNGSGKTTFIKLLCRLYDPSEGEILLNGIDNRKYRYDDYISIFSVVFQDFKLLAFPLGENIAVCDTYNRQRVIDAIEKAGFSDKLKDFPNGIETYLYKDFDKDGVEVSGGEAQKIAIARALYKDASFLILDEPTAALDPMAEAEIYRRLNELVQDRTAVYISHRLSSCRFCDEIVVFDNGQIVQQGTHEWLLSDKKGKYYELWQAQAQYYQ